ncbi:MAG: hypothetical protein ACLFSQ_10940 [Candidatus Zixiibacteriota bacterium]
MSLFFMGCFGNSVLAPLEHYSDGYYECEAEGCYIQEKIDIIPVLIEEGFSGQNVDPSRIKFMKYCDYYYLIGPGFYNVWIGQLEEGGIEFEPVNLDERVLDPIFPSVKPAVVLQYKTQDGRKIAISLKECEK